ncbi:hypothetical protein [Streptomyces sp. HB2AG]|uniref:hypothetical protein n=1 Tax=Streptomyces sp. HB2AG TaxID=2983400 RepID=UPI0022AA6C8E|nr:hypothetical protein [Streptomyces sp. HB2AG]MCZ2525072.1 hypothetical protein [Streptomyces sp. HB2AG]
MAQDEDDLIYTPAESLHNARLFAAAVYRAGRGRDLSALDRRREQLREKAWLRQDAEHRTRLQAEAEQRAKKAAKKVRGRK